MTSHTAELNAQRVGLCPLSREQSIGDRKKILKLISEGNVASVTGESHPPKEEEAFGQKKPGAQHDSFLANILFIAVRAMRANQCKRRQTNGEGGGHLEVGLLGDEVGDVPIRPRPHLRLDEGELGGPLRRVAEAG